MLLMSVLLIALTLGLGYANGANDVSKGIATLVGSGVTEYRRAVLWGTGWTIAGGVLAGLLASGMVATFSGQALLASAPAGGSLPVAVACGAIGWLVVATLTGLPVSTTHALLGGLCGAGIAAQGISGVLWGAVGWRAALPLAVSPVLSLALMAVLFPLIRTGYRRFERYCVCLERQELVSVGPMGAAAMATSRALTVIAGADCPPQVVSRVNLLDSLHWFSAGLTSLFRGLNDAPKILALGVAAAAATGISQPSQYVLIAVAMGAGSYLAGARVTGTLAAKVTRMRPGEGFAANLVTSLLVASASGLALPVSTTHVSSSAIIGLGLHNRDVRWRTVSEMLLAWLITIPVAGSIAWLAYSMVA
jgi:PiT family inorganic phosphate transporter